MFRLSGSVAVLLLAMQSLAAADQPLREHAEFDVDIPAMGASAVCGFPIRQHIVGSSTFTLFYDKDGNIDREVDTFPNLKVTVYRPGTDLSYTSSSPAVLHTQYTNGAAIGSTATAEVTGRLERIPGVGMDSGRLVFSAVVVRLDAAGVPVITSTGVISSVGPSFDQPIRFERCAFFRQ
jgi:hypothetical protein